MTLHPVTPEILIGIDPSQTGLGIVAVPADWSDCAWDRVRSASFGRSLKRDSEHRELVRLAGTIAHDVVAWIRWVLAPLGQLLPEDPRVRVFSEQHMDHGGMHGHTRVVRVGSVVEDRLANELGLYVTPVNVASARKLFLGKVPKGAKDIVWQAIHGQTDVIADKDQADALVVQNYGRYLLGLPCLSGAIVCECRGKQ